MKYIHPSPELNRLARGMLETFLKEDKAIKINTKASNINVTEEVLPKRNNYSAYLMGKPLREYKGVKKE